MQQGPTHPKDGLVYPRTLPERQIYIHGTRWTRHGAFHHIQEGEKSSVLHILYVTFFKMYIELKSFRKIVDKKYYFFKYF